MGNKLCKKKSYVDNAKTTPTTFHKIMNTLHLRPKAWKSDLQLNQPKQVRSNSNIYVPREDKVLSKSLNWTDMDLEVTCEKDRVIHLQNPKLSLIFDSKKLNTPTPPPRNHKKGIREKMQAVAKTSLQPFQNKKPVDEPLCMKKIVQPTSPDDHTCTVHRQEQEKGELPNQLKNVIWNIEFKRRKNLSVISLPNYNELKLTVAHFDENIDKKSEQISDSLISLPSSSEPKKITHIASTGKIVSCMTRCRSFGSILPQQFFDKLRVKKISADIGSDDSFGGLEDWDLRLIEHYNPKDASLPRPQKLHNKLPTDIESLIVQVDDTPKPQVLLRKSEPLLKKINPETCKTVQKSFRDQESHCLKGMTPPPSPNCQLPTGQQTLKIEELPIEEI